MGLPSCLIDPSLPLVLDASVLINLNATGYAKRILDSLPHPIAVTDVVAKELERGRSKGRTDANLVDEIVHSGRAKRVALSPDCEAEFLSLVAGDRLSTLDDGEAATIAWAVSCNGIAVIDEKKGIAICRERHPKTRLASTIDLFRCDQVRADLTGEMLGDAVFAALSIARMRVLETHLAWVIETIGVSRAALCSSLPRSIRDQMK